MKKNISFLIAALTILLSTGLSANSQQYKLRQSNSMMGMKTESTIYVKGMRKRTEPGSMMGMPAQPITIEQCDLQRTIKINNKKKLYFIEPFAKEDVIEEDAKPAVVKTKPVTTQPKTTPEKGGVINMWYNITDTGERKKMNGFIARHVWTSQKIKPSPEACTMKDSIIIKTDGWYIDLPQFNCPVRYTSSSMPTRPTDKPQPECKDRYVTHRSGKGKLGFPLTETRTIIMGGEKTSEFQTSLETIEFSSEKLDSMLFEIPPGYTLATNETELQDKFDMNDMINQYKTQNLDNDGEKIAVNEQKPAGTLRIGVYEPKGDGQVQTSDLQKYLASILFSGKISAVSVVSEDEARKYNCDYTLTTEFIKIKQASKVGGLLKAIKNSDPNAASSFNIEASLTLISLGDGSVRSQPSVSGKFEGKVDDAAKRALDDGGRQILKAIK